MAKQNFLNDLYVGGVSLRETYGVEITGEAVYNAPARDVEFISVPGRNGELVIDHGRFENIEVTYPCSIAAGYQANIDGLRAYLKTLVGYVEISDTYHPDEYRLGVYVAGLETTNAWKMTGGTFDLVFNCKPQRFLRSGDEPIEILSMAYIATATTYKWSTLEIPAEIVGPSTTFSSPAGYGYLVESRDAYDHKIGEYTGTSSGPDYSVYLSSLMTSGAAYCSINFNQPTNGSAENCVRMRWQDDDGAHDARSAVELTNPTLYTAKPLITAHGGNGIGEIPMQIGDVFVYTNLLGSSTGTEDFTSYIDTEDEASYYVDTATGAVTPFNYSGANRVDGLHFSEYNIGLGKAVLSPGTTYVGMTTANVSATGDAMSAYIYPRWWTI
jgi:phage-related protein